MSEKKLFISYRRVSTWKQNRSGLGMEAQREIINSFVNYEKGEIVADYEETYTGKELTHCVELHKAMAHAKKIGATLIIAKTDRFRNTKEALEIWDDMGGRTYFCDCPNQDKFTLTLMFAIAEREALMISLRTKAALAAKKKRDGSWAHLYGKNTGTTREQSLEKARDAQARVARQRALDNPNNEKFWSQVQIFERAHSMSVLDDLDAFTQDLITAKVKTSNGCEMTPSRARSMYHRMKLRYS